MKRLSYEFSYLESNEVAWWRIKEKEIRRKIKAKRILEEFKKAAQVGKKEIYKII